jgi:hypothetical protein
MKEKWNNEYTYPEDKTLNNIKLEKVFYKKFQDKYVKIINLGCS